MDKRLFIYCVIFVFSSMCSKYQDQYLFVNHARGNQASTTWTIVGAGPAGITVLGLLLDLGISGSDITWVDPAFNVGRLGDYYQTVPANNKAKLFVQYINSCKVFQECNTPAIERLYQSNPEHEYELKIIVDPLKDITHHLMQKVSFLQTHLESLHFDSDIWHVGTDAKNFTSHYVVLATGAHPRSLDYQCEQEIPLDIAINKELLAKEITEEDTVAVVGDAHSALLILKFLSELPTKRIINFYKHDPRFAVDMGDWILHDASGLTGITARWAQEILMKNPPANLVRIYNSQEAREAWLPVCNKIIYAVGFERNEVPYNNEISYDYSTGIIAPHLFGIGIGFPEQYVDPFGNVEQEVGLLPFMRYAQRILPEWMKKDSLDHFAQFDPLFTINQL